MARESWSGGKIWSRMLTVTGSAEDLCWNLGERDNAGEDAQVSANPWHTVDGATCFILTESEAAPAVNCVHPFCTIRAHTSHDDAQGEISVGLGYRRHHHVDRWNVRKIVGVSVETDESA